MASCGAQRVSAGNLRLARFESRKFSTAVVPRTASGSVAAIPPQRGAECPHRAGVRCRRLYTRVPTGAYAVESLSIAAPAGEARMNIPASLYPPAAPIIVPRSPYPRPTPRHPADLDVARIAPPDHSDAKKDRRLSSFSIFNAGFSLLKSLGKSASKRKRDANADEDLEEDDDSASKRTRGATGYAQGPGSAFITSSVRKSKGESSTSSSRYDRSATRIATALDARGVARSAFSNPKS